MAFRIKTQKAKQVNREEKISDEILIGRIAALDEAAFTEIYQRYANRMLRFFYRMLKQDQDEAEDFAQDLFLKVIEKSDSFNPRHKFSTWLYTLASNMVKNEYRKRSIRDRYKQESKWEAAAFDPEMEKLLDLQNFNTELLKALEFISPEQKGAIVLRYQEGLSLKEISEISNCAVGTVKSRLYYGLHNLSEKLTKYRSEE